MPRFPLCLLALALVVALFAGHPMALPRAAGIAAPLHGDLVEVTPVVGPGGQLVL